MQRRVVLRGIGALGASMLVGCGKGVSAILGPTDGPTTPTGNWVRVNFNSLRHQAPVVGAAVLLPGGSQLVTGSSGGRTAPEGGIIEITSAGTFGPRRVRVVAGLQDWLLPDDTQMPAWWIKQALYGANDSQWLWRPLSGAMTVVPSADVFADPFAMDAIRDGADIINEVHRSLSFVIGSPGQTSGRVIDIRVNPAVTAYALSSIKYKGATTTGGLIEFSMFRLPGFSRSDQIGHATRAVAHELAHIAGLSGHPTAIPGVYSSGIMWGEGIPQKFAQPEIDILNWMFHREPGTRPPDDSSATPVVATSDFESHWMPICRLER